MAENKIYYIRKNKVSDIPRNLLFLDCETRPEIYEGYDLHIMRMAWTWSVRLKKGGEIESESWDFWRDSDKLYEYVIKRARGGNTLCIIGSNIIFDLFASGLAERLIRDGWEASFLYYANMCCIIPLRKGAKRIKFLSVQNFVRGSVESWGKLLGKRKIECDPLKDPYPKVKRYCKRDTEITGRMFLAYIRFIIDKKLGGFSPTISSQAYRAYRHRFMDYKILHFDREDVNEFVRNSYMGGRNECYKLGEFIGEDLVKFDVNSMYPYVMAENEYPTKLAQVCPSPRLDYLYESLEKYSVIADCYICTNEPVYGKRIGGKLCFPTGRFRTHLCSETLKYAIESNHVFDVVKAILYEKAPIFDRYVGFFYALKEQYSIENDPVWREIVKMFLNSLYGKFGELRDIEILNEPDISGELYRENIYFEDTGEFGIEWSGFGRHVITRGKKEAPTSQPAIASHVTDNARLYLWKLMNTVGRENVYYVDTDSLICPKKPSLSRFSSFMGEDIGKLKIEAQGQYMELRGCKDYTFESLSKTKGLKKDAILIGEHQYKQNYFPSLATIMRLGITEGFPVMEIEKDFAGEYDKGEVSESGEVLPFHLEEDSPEP